MVNSWFRFFDVTKRLVVISISTHFHWKTSNYTKKTFSRRKFKKLSNKPIIMLELFQNCKIFSFSTDKYLHIWNNFRSDLKDFVQAINDKVPNEEENRNCDVDLVSSFADMLAGMKKSLEISS